MMAVKKKAMAKKKATMHFHRMPDGTMMAGKHTVLKKKK
jgi:hypothetical protein